MDAEETEPPGKPGLIVEWNDQDVADVGLSDPIFLLLVDAVKTTLRQHQVSQAEVSIAIVSGQTMRRLNREYLQHDYDTDVLSFDLSQQPERGLMGQLIVSLNYAQQQASRIGRAMGRDIPFQYELALYAVHGTLHLIGWDDQDHAQRLRMRAGEQQILQQLGITAYWPDAVEPEENSNHLLDTEAMLSESDASGNASAKAKQ